LKCLIGSFGYESHNNETSLGEGTHDAGEDLEDKNESGAANEEDDAGLLS
jgi:hypothetical protein